MAKKDKAADSGAAVVEAIRKSGAGKVKVAVSDADGKPHPACPRQTLKRVLKRAEKMGYGAMVGAEFEFFNFSETPHTWAEKKGIPPTPISPGMFGYSLLRANLNREYFNALMDDSAAFGIPIEGLHTETGPGVYEVAIMFSEALEAADRAILFKTAAKEIGHRFGIMPSFMAKWSAQYPGCSGRASRAGRRERSSRRNPSPAPTSAVKTSPAHRAASSRRRASSASRRSRATGSATTSSTTSRRRAIGNGASGRTR